MLVLLSDSIVMVYFIIRIRINRVNKSLSINLISTSVQCRKSYIRFHATFNNFEANIFPDVYVLGSTNNLYKRSNSILRNLLCVWVVNVEKCCAKYKSKTIEVVEYMLEGAISLSENVKTSYFLYNLSEALN